MDTNPNLGSALGSGSQPPPGLLRSLADDQIDLAVLIRLVWRRRWWVIAFTSICVVLAVIYALLAPPVYRAEATLLPTQDKTAGGLGSRLAQLGGLAGLAGIGQAVTGKQEPMGVLQSRGFARRFILENKLEPVLSKAQPHLWSPEEREQSDIRTIVRTFGKDVLSVEEDKKTGLVTIAVQWRDPQIAADWANAIVRQINDEMRDRALGEAERNIAYLREQLEVTQNVALQQSIARLLEDELQKVMLARGSEDYAFQVIDAAEAPLLRAKPKRTLIVVVSFFCALVLSVVMVLLVEPLAHLARSARQQ